MPATRRRKKPPLNPEAEWHGFTRVSPENKTAEVRRVFDSVASSYDLMNDLMSGGLHRLWKNRLVEMMNPKARQTILDVAGGTGDIALRCAGRTDGEARVIVCDINPAMLRIGRDKAVDRGFLPILNPSPLEGEEAKTLTCASKSLVFAGGGVSSEKTPSPAKTKALLRKAKFLRPLPPGERKQGIEWVIGDAEAMPFKDRSADTICIAFGLRNVTRIDTALKEFKRVLKPGGRFFCLEFSPGVAPWLKELYDLYSFAVLPWLGGHVAGDRASYQYLAESIRKFPDQQSLAKRLKTAGFSRVQWNDLTGGIAVIHSGWRNQ